MQIEWGPVEGRCVLTVLPTLEDQDVILGMDVLRRLGVIIAAGPGKAWPHWVASVDGAVGGTPLTQGAVERTLQVQGAVSGPAQSQEAVRGTPRMQGAVDETPQLQEVGDKMPVGADPPVVQCQDSEGVFMVMRENMKIPAGKSRVFFLETQVPGLVLFEPGIEMPEGLQGVPTLSKGPRLVVQLDNHSSRDITLNPQWTIGKAFPVQLVVKAPPATGKELPDIPNTLTAKQRRQLQDLLMKYKDIFARKGEPITSTPFLEHEIHTNGPPVRLPSRRQNPLIREQEQQQIQEMLRDGVVRPSVSPWASPVVMVKKKDNSMRFCVDFRKVNDATIKDAHPLPRIDDTLESLHGAKYFSTLDLKSGYWQVPIKEQHKEKTAFRTSSGQLFEFNQLPFGLCNAPATFSRLMDRTLAGLAWNICLYYLDDIIIFSRTWEEHLERLEIVFQRLREANLKLGASKCELAKEEVTFLGYKVTPRGLEPDPRLMEAIASITPPTTVTEVRSFLGLVGYYRRFIRKFSDKAAPLNQLTRKDHPWQWTKQCQEAFELLKDEISNRPVSAYPDFSLPFRLYTDASNIGLGAILAQKQEGKECIICCASRTLSPSEVNYSATKKECLAIVWGITTFRPFLIATKFEVITDHYSLQWLRSMKNESALLHRWAAALEDFQFTVLHRPGKQQGHVDGLSRLPLANPVFTLEGKIRVDDQEALRVIQAVHREGHLGARKTWQAFNKKYSTDMGRKKCLEVVRSCSECQLGKDYKQQHAPKGTIRSPKPWDLVSIDIMGPFPQDDRFNRFIVTLMDVYSRYLIAVPVRDHTAQTVGRVLYERGVAYYGVPRSILSDRGSEFTGQVWRSLTQMLGTEIVLTSPYYPQGNALIERSHRTLNNMLRTSLLETGGTRWSTLLPSTMLYINAMTQEHTGYSACEIFFGRNSKLPSDISFTPATAISEDREGYVKNVKRELGKVREKLKRTLGHEKTPQDNPFKVGEQVLIRLQPLEIRSKLDAKWKGPCTVTKIPNKFQVEYKENGVKKISHISL